MTGEGYEKRSFLLPQSPPLFPVISFSGPLSDAIAISPLSDSRGKVCSVFCLVFKNYDNGSAHKSPFPHGRHCLQSYSQTGHPCTAFLLRWIEGT